MAYLRGCRGFDDGPAMSTVLRMRGSDGLRVVEMLCKPHHKAAREYFIAMIDVTEQRQFQREREESAQARAALAGRLISIQEDERLRIARDLHDNLGQVITGLRLRLDAIALAKTVDDRFDRQVQEALTLVERLDRGVDFIATELRPASLDFGFDIALQQFVNDWSTTFGIEAAFHSTPLAGLRLSSETQTHLYRIAQEALNNVYKHSGATRTSVILERRQDSLVLLVEDDGRGFEHAHLERAGRRSLGLIGMRERATMIGATLEVESARGKGTTVFVTVPGAFVANQRAAHVDR
jgi:signal transduction histidine kinase